MSCSIPVEGKNPGYGAVALPEAHTSHALVRKLQESGATLCGATRVDATPPHTIAACGTCRAVGNPGHNGRLVLGSHGAACALVAAGGVSVAVGVDSGGDMLLPAACMGLYALRTSQDEMALSHESLLQPTSSCACCAVALKGNDNLLKVRPTPRFEPRVAMGRAAHAPGPPSRQERVPHRSARAGG
jgi:Asp-tRNA(Asn)/Glu-tRNA(Gln) amidotransferase A subunit family amidase